MSDEYHNRPEISRSMLMEFRRSRRLYHARFVAKTIEPDAEKPAMQIGTLTHCAILQGAQLDSMMAIIPKKLLSADGGIRTAEAKEWKAAAEAAGKIVVKDHEAKSTLAPIIAMRDAILASQAGHWFGRRDAIAETPIVWTDSETGLALRALPDFRLDLPDSHLATDVKTCADIRRFPKQVAESYWMQHAHYEDAIRTVSDKPVTFTFLAVEKDPPHLVRCYEMDAAMQADAVLKWRQTLRELAECYASGDWADPGEDDLIPISERIW